MKVQSLEIYDFRGIDKLKLEFSPDSPTVLIGINGVGKSSILDCLAILLSILINRILFSRSSGSSIFHEFAGKLAELAKILSNSLNLEEQNNLIFSNNKILPRDKDIKRGTEEFYSKVSITSNNFSNIQWSFSKKAKRELTFDVDQISSFVQKLTQTPSNGSSSLPVLVYYPTNRTVLDTPLSIPEEYSFKQTDVYDDGKIEQDIGFNSFFLWFRSLEDVENEERRDNADYRDKRLQAVRDAIYSLIPGFENLRVRRSPLRMTVNKNGEEVMINQLSDGEKCLLAMVGDLARRLAIANPGLPDPLQGEGVVLIDEIELHLHPQWQREIIPALTRTFPHCQFIVTTHSPQIVSHVQPENVYVLESTPDGGIVAQRPSSSYGRDSNRILEDLMETPARPQNIKNEILELFRIIDRGDLEKAKELRDRIIEEIGSDEPELVKAGVSIRRKEILNR